MLKSRVLYVALSPPAPACFTTTWPMVRLAPRSISSHSVATSEPHLSLLPPVTLPFTALSGVSLVLQEALAVAGLKSARLPEPGVAVGVGVGVAVGLLGVGVGVGVGPDVGV